MRKATENWSLVNFATVENGSSAYQSRSDALKLGWETRRQKRSQSWFPGRLDRAMKRKRPSSAAFGIFPRMPMSGRTQTTPVITAWRRFV